MSTFYVRSFFVAILTVYVGLSLKRFADNPELVAPDAYWSLVLALVIAVSIAGIVQLKQHVTDVVLTAVVVLGGLKFIDLVSMNTLKLGGIVLGWFVMLALILCAHWFTQYLNSGEAKPWNEILANTDDTDDTVVDTDIQGETDVDTDAGIGGLFRSPQ